MAKYTTELRSLVENGYPIFDFDYPIFDKKYRYVLEQKIINYYYFREIGFETPAKFKHFLKSRLEVIMPYYNQLYKTIDLVNEKNWNVNLDNLITRKQTTDTIQSGEGEMTSNSNSTMTGDGSTDEVFSDTPQARLQGKDYATNMTENKSTSTNKANDSSTGRNKQKGTAKTIEEYTEHLLGNGSMRYNADILMEWRKSFINVDEQIIGELEDLFMGIY